ncbi:MAG: RluA family pseudouridine synthase [Candidatus Saccharimonadales bacterium]
MSNLEISRAQRLDQRVVEIIPQLSRAFAVKLIEDGKVTVRGQAIQKAGYKLRDSEAETVKVDYDLKEISDIPLIELPIIYEDDDCVVINKPLGLLSHSKGIFNPEATVETWLRSRTKLTGARAGIVHRLDRATSGVMICAKTPEALSWLQKQFAQRKTKKTYAAIINGQLDPPEAIIDMPIGRNPKAPATFRTDVQGKHAITHYRTVKTTDRYSLLELKPETGRTHQLRVHLAHFGHPIVGDTMYGGQPADRMYLHAEQLELTLLSNHERKVFDAPLPASFREFMNNG